MAKNTPTATLGLFVTTGGDDQYREYKASFVWVGQTPDEIRDGEPASKTRLRNLRNDFFSDDAVGGLFLGGLEIASTSYKHHTPNHWDLGYRHPYGTIKVREAEGMMKTLRAIERRLEKLADVAGRPASFGTYLQQVATATKATRIVLPARDWNRRDYDDAVHRVYDTRSAAVVIDDEIAQWVAQGTPEAVSA